MATPAVELSSLERTLGLKGLLTLLLERDVTAVTNDAIATLVPVLQTNNAPCLEGLTTIASHLVKAAKKEELLGTTPEQCAVVQQWLEYRVIQVDSCTTQDDKKIILKDLSCYLEDKVYLAGNSFTLADIMLYNGLHPIVAALTHEDREKYVNVSRWFNHIQHYPGVRQHSAAIIFVRNRLYPNVH
ncbi:eukaryotic translation elongation factor 1 epsilon-1 isoform X2 [Hypanus sabinus]|uniref:eukaryotic translation elongation factor 1 epsilon-1 isoform X2 n=1 Tax=Hypanus sabinus TaxID=79690 RepID=UPI0028C4192B|nr:eukaryotic translation elongation factor 1 epsilon-1 isoform X2 [Hypanus sabinus]